MQELDHIDVLDEESLRTALGGDGHILSLHLFDSIDSTNNEAKRLTVKGVHTPALIVAQQQTAGRGRLGRSFFSPAQTGIYFSILYQTKAPLESAVSITGAASVALMRAIRSLSGQQTLIKWVNDLYLDGKKVAGILTEAVSNMKQNPYVIVGIGVNLRTEAFPPELEQKAGSVGGNKVLRADLIAAVWQELKVYLEDPTDKSWLNDYRAHSCVIGKPIQWTHEGCVYEGIAVGIDQSGGLEVELPNGQRDVLRTGEISITLNPN